MKVPLVAILASQLICATSLAADGVELEDRLKIATVLQKLSVAWRFGDSDDWTEPFVDDAYFTVLYDMGESESERTAWDYQFIFDHFRADAVFDLNIRQVRFVKPDVAVVNLSGFYVETGEDVAIRKFLIPTAILKRSKSDWKIVSFTNTPFVVNELRANGDLLRFKRISAEEIRLH